MSDTLKGVIIGAILTGIFLVAAQVLTGVVLIAVQLLSARSQADAARDAWNRSQKAERHAELEAMCVEILRYIQEIQHAVVNLEAGGTNLTAEQFIDTVNGAARAVMLSGYSLIVRNGPEEPTPPLVGRVIDEARAFSALYHVNRNPPATATEKKRQAAVVTAAADALRAHIHAMVKADG
jgi:hypothetical protein